MSGMNARDMLDEPAQRCKDIAERLAGAGIGEKDHEIDGMPDIERDTDLGLSFEASNARAMARSRVNDNDRRLAGINAVVPALVPDLNDAQQGIVGRGLELACIEYHFRVEVENRR